MSVRNLETLFAPASVAIVGVNDRPGNVGMVVWRNLKAGGFKGTFDLTSVSNQSDTVEFGLAGAPTLPGFGFSGKPSTTGWGVQRIARAWAELRARSLVRAAWEATAARASRSKRKRASCRPT